MNSQDFSHGWQDITYSIQEGMVHWPGDLEVRIERKLSIDKGDDANVTDLHMSAHTGTHMDAPLHFFKTGQDISAIPLDIAVGEAMVLHFPDAEMITADMLRQHDIPKGSRVLCKTKNSERNWVKQPMNEAYVALTLDAGQYLVEKEVKLIGVDYLSVGRGDENLELHRTLLGNGVWIVEGLDLRLLTPGRYQLICLPMKIETSDGAPARALVRKMEE